MDGSRTNSQITRGEAEAWQGRLKESPLSLGVLSATIVGFSIISLRVAGLLTDGKKSIVITDGEIALMKCSTCGQRIESPAVMDSFYLSMTKRFTRIEYISYLMEKNYGITCRQLRMKRRTYSLSQQRHIFCKLASEFSEASYPMIGRFINRDHTTVLHSVDAKLDTEYTKIYDDLRRIITEGEADVAFINSA